MAEQTGSGLTPGLERAWGLAERPAKGPKPTLSTERIVAAAIAVAGAEGLDALSMGRVAKELGSSPMSLYRYVASKDELLILMQDAASGSPPPGPDPEEGWRPALVAWAEDLRGRYAEHPWIVRVPVSGPPVTPHSVQWMERGLAALRATGLNAGDKMGVILLVSTYVGQSVRMYADLEDAYRRGGRSPEESMRAYGTLLARLTDAERFPELTAVLASGELDKADEVDDDFRFGLEVTLDGVAALVAARE